MNQSAQQQHHRQSIRIPHFDYSQPGYYFVTVCTKDRGEYFGNIENAEIKLFEIGEITDLFWKDIPNRFPNAELDDYVVMPNHFHGIIVLRDSNGRDAPRRVPTDGSVTRGFGTLQRNSLSSVVNHFKGNVKRWCNKNGFEHFFWQSNYYEHVIRNEQSLSRIREYIANNSLKWELDIENPKCRKPDKNYYEKIFDA